MVVKKANCVFLHNAACFITLKGQIPFTIFIKHKFLSVFLSPIILFFVVKMEVRKTEKVSVLFQMIVRGD